MTKLIAATTKAISKASPTNTNLQIDYLLLILYSKNFDRTAVQLQEICIRFGVQLIHQKFSVQSFLINSRGKYSYTPETYEITLYLEERPYQGSNDTTNSHNYLVSKSDSEKLLQFYSLWVALVPLWRNLVRLDLKRILCLVPGKSWKEELELAYLFAIEQREHGKKDYWKRFVMTSTSPNVYDDETSSYSIYLGTRTNGSSLLVRICSNRDSGSYAEIECKNINTKFAHFLKIGNISAFYEICREKYDRTIRLLMPCLYTRELKAVATQCKSLVRIEENQFLRGVPVVTQSEEAKPEDVDSLLLITLFCYLSETEGSPLQTSLGMYRFEICFLKFCRLILNLGDKTRVRQKQQDIVKRSLINLFQINILSFTHSTGRAERVGVQRFISNLEYASIKNKETLIIWLCLEGFKCLKGFTPLPTNLLKQVFAKHPAEGAHLQCFLEITKAICNGQGVVQVKWAKRVGHKHALRELESFAFFVCTIYKGNGRLEDFTKTKSTYRALCLHLQRSLCQPVEVGPPTP